METLPPGLISSPDGNQVLFQVRYSARTGAFAESFPVAAHFEPSLTLRTIAPLFSFRFALKARYVFEFGPLGDNPELPIALPNFLGLKKDFGMRLGHTAEYNLSSRHGLGH
jgi:hypothetical protein